MIAVLASTSEFARRTDFLLGYVQRPSVSYPVVYGPQIVPAALGIPEFTKLWDSEKHKMSTRLQSMRQGLNNEHVGLQAPGEPTNIIKQTRILGYLGISPNQIRCM